MIPRRYIEGYLFFLLRHKYAVSAVITAVTLFFVYFMYAHMQIATNFFDLYPPGHPYIQLYQKYRPMFGTANVLQIVVETPNGTIFDNPETFKAIEERVRRELGISGHHVLAAPAIEPEARRRELPVARDEDRPRIAQPHVAVGGLAEADAHRRRAEQRLGRVRVVGVAHEQLDALAARRAVRVEIHDRSAHRHQSTARRFEAFEPLLGVMRPCGPHRAVGRPLGGHTESGAHGCRL